MRFIHKFNCFQLTLILVVSTFSRVAQAKTYNTVLSPESVRLSTVHTRQSNHNYNDYIAQAIPDTTLGTESSLVTPNTLVNGSLSSLIEGGAIRGTNLFHSFQDFDVIAGEKIYFSHPAGVENILSRVTGNTISDIDGLLGVSGTANLFLLNPNGIIFGPEGQLDISGSFTASTADSIPFTDGSEFSALPEENLSLTMQVPLGVQLGSRAQGNISSTGALTVGEDLTLFGNNFYLKGQLLAGRFLRIVAENDVAYDAITVDGVSPSNNLDDSEVFIEAGNGIYGFDTLKTPLSSSNLNIEFRSGGDMELHALITEGGNILLKSLDGNITIQRLLNATNGADAGGNISIAAAGNITLNDALQTFSYSERENSGDGGNISIFSSNGDIIVNKLTESFSISELSNAGNGGDISITAASGGVEINDSVIAVSASSSAENSGEGNFGSTPGGNASNGGNISIVSGSGDIIVNRILDSSSVSFLGEQSGNGGMITLASSSGDIIVRDSIDSSSFSPRGKQSGNGGIVSISSNESGFVEVNEEIISFSAASTGQSGDSGAITLLSEDGDIEINERLFASSYSEFGDAGRGGTLSITSVAGNIAVNGSGEGSGIVLDSSSYAQSSGNAATAGSITVSSTAGNVSLNGVTSSTSFSEAGSSGDGGRILVSSESGDLTINRDVLSFSGSRPLTEGRNAGNGGAITITAQQGNISTNGVLNSGSYSRTGQAGSGGAITLSSRGGSFDGNNNTQVFTSSISEVGSSTGNGGNLLLEGSEALAGITQTSTLSSAADSGDIEILGFGDLTIRDVDITASAQIEIPNPIGDNIIILDTSGFGQSGNISISGVSDLRIQDVSIQSDANGRQSAGSLTVTSPGSVLLDSSEILTDTNSLGAGGGVTFSESDALILKRTTISTDTAGQGLAGSITLENIGAIVLRDGSLLLAEANESENGGSVVIEADFVVAVPIENNDIIANASAGDGGTILIRSKRTLGATELSGFNTDQLQSNTSSDISASSEFGQEGEVSINNLENALDQGLNELPINLADAANEIDEGCIANASENGESRFIQTGRGGLPTTPSDSVTSTAQYVPWVTAEEGSGAISTAMPEPLVSDREIVEAQGWTTQSDGRVFFVAEAQGNISFRSAFNPHKTARCVGSS